MAVLALATAAVCSQEHGKVWLVAAHLATGADKHAPPTLEHLQRQYDQKQQRQKQQTQKQQQQREREQQQQRRSSRSRSSRRREVVILRAPPSPFSRCANSDREQVSAK